MKKSSIFDKDSKSRSFWWLTPLFFPLSLFWSEFTFKLAVYGIRPDLSWLYVFLLSVGAGLLVSAAVSLLPQRAGFVTSVVLSALSLVFFSFQLVYFRFFRNFFLWQTLSLASDLTEFWYSALLATLAQWFMIIVFALPLILLCVFRRRFEFEKRPRLSGLSAAAAVAVSVIGILLILPSSTYRLAYFGTYSADSSVHDFGLVQNTVLELRSLLFRSSSPLADPEPTPEPEPEPAPVEKVVEYNVMDLDFDTLIANESDPDVVRLHKYFSGRTPSAKNSYTGLFKGKNLILLTLEGFSDKCIDPVHTPTLYKMYNEGFVFDNFYNSLWGGSTATGEYAVATGNFYFAATALKRCLDKSFPFVMGNALGREGYLTKSYHDHTYTYYNRHLAHAAWGYDYTGVGNGLEIKKTWPESDLEMMEITASDYGSSEPFHAYYMTVSGHAEYSFNDNMMCQKNHDLVDDMDASESVRAYVACQIELDRALKSLIDQLEAAGTLQNTVFAMAADHYPYALDEESLAELYGLPKDDILNNFDLYRNGFILWTPVLRDSIHITKPCSSIDILPTLLNLFGVEYDSRLIMGTDIFSDKDAPVLLNSVGNIGSRHWITAQGSYNAHDRVFTPSATCTLEGEALDSYVSDMKGIVERMQTYSPMILDHDYYAKVFK